MGFTPLEGLIMATRAGDIDPGAVLYLAEKLGKSFEELEYYFNNQCGLLGLLLVKVPILESFWNMKKKAI